MWWTTEPGALYTVLIEDNEPELPPPTKIAHFLAVNIQGKEIFIDIIIVNNDYIKQGAAVFTTSKSIATVFMSNSGCPFVISDFRENN